ncbi:MAG: tetratricopeptide repeat protein [Bacteroidia bacterium]
MKRKPPVKKQAVATATDFREEINPNAFANLKTMMLIIIAAFSFLLYANTLNHNYAVDDGTVMQNNKIVKKGISAIPEIFSTRYRAGFWERKENMYRPLSLVMFAIEWQLSPEKPFLGHLVNVLLYMLTGVLLFITLTKLLPQKNLLIPFLTTLLFIAHPIHTEVVVNIKSRDEILCFLGVIASINFLMDYIRSSKIISLIISLFCFLLSLLSKESAITFIFIVPLVLHFFTAVDFKKIIKTSFYFIGAAIVYMAIRGAVLKGLASETELQIVNNSLLGATDFITRFASAMYIMGKYLLLLFFPHPLVFDYSYNEIKNVPVTDIRTLLSIAIYLSLFIYALKTFKQKNFISFGILFFLITISLVSNIFFLIESTLAERFVYMPSLGFCFVIVIVMTKMFKSETIKNTGNFSALLKSNSTLFSVVLIVLVLFSFKTISRNADWKNNLTLLAQDVKTSPESARIRYAYGSAILIEQALKEKDKTKKYELLDKSIEQLEKGVAILNTYSDAFYHLGLAYKEKEDYPNAIKNLEAAQNGKKWTEADFFVAMGIAYGGAKQFDKAIANLNKAIEIDPKNADPYNNLGLYYDEMGDKQNAIKSLNKAIELNPKFDKAYYNLGNTYAKSGDYNKAIDFYKKAFAIDPVYEDAYNNTGNSYAAMKDYANAIVYYKKVIEINPSNLKVLNNIGVTYKMMGDDVNGDKYFEMVKTATQQ